MYDEVEKTDDEMRRDVFLAHLRYDADGPNVSAWWILFGILLGVPAVAVVCGLLLSFIW